VLSRGKVKAQVQTAKMQMGQIENAIHSYVADYSRYPASTFAATAAAQASSGAEDFTFGTQGLAQMKTPGGPMDIFAVNGAATMPNTPKLNYQTNNSELMAILMDMTNYPAFATTPTVNANYVKNPQRNKYLNATMVTVGTLPGVGPDLVYRDPWLQPYIVTIDLNSDDKARDSLYRSQTVSQNGAPPA